MGDLAHPLTLEPDLRTARGLGPVEAATARNALEAVIGLTSGGAPVSLNRPIWIVGDQARTAATFETTGRGEKTMTRLTLVGDLCCTFETLFSHSEAAPMPRTPQEGATDGDVLSAMRAYALFWEHQVAASRGAPERIDDGGAIAEATRAVAALTRDRATAAGFATLHVGPAAPWGDPILRVHGPGKPIRTMDAELLDGHRVRVPSRIHLSVNDVGNGLHLEFQPLEHVVDYAGLDMVEGLRAVMRRAEAR